MKGLQAVGVAEMAFATLLEPMVLRLLPEELVLAYNQIDMREKAYTTPTPSGDATSTGVSKNG